MLRNWRSWALLVLLVGPYAVFVGLGALWLYQRGWGVYGFTAWVVATVAFGYLANRWTKDRRAVLPPIDWDVPQTFSQFDRKAWDLVQEEASQGDALPMDRLLGVDIYIDTGRRLAKRLAAHYHPLATDPIEHVPVVEILAALELATEDLGKLCREVPGGDLLTYAHWKRAVQASGYISKANEIYGYLLPLFQPVTGLVRLGTQKLMVQPAWKNMQQNVLRWFYRAFVNRLGTHLIELYSGRLAIGADTYRRLKRKGWRGVGTGAEGPAPLVIAVAGARDSGKTRLIAALDQARSGDLSPVRHRLEAAGHEPDLADHIKAAQLVEVPGYTVHDEEHARDRATRRDAVEEAVEADFLLLVVGEARTDLTPEVKFLDEWSQWFATRPNLEPPPVLAVVTTGTGGPTGPSNGRATVETVRAALPSVVAEVVGVGLETEPPAGLSDRLLPALAPLLHRAERTALLRHFHRLSTRSKARRLVSQVGRQGRRLWEGVKSARQARAGTS